MRRRTPYVLIWVGLFGGLAALLFEPLGTPVANVVVGGAFLGLAIGSVIYLIAEFSGPGERGPDF